MQLKDLPEQIQSQILNWSNAHMRANPSIDINLTCHLDEAQVAGMQLEANRHNSKCEHLWQTLNALRIAVLAISPTQTEYVPFLNLVDQCLVENKPEIL